MAAAAAGRSVTTTVYLALGTNLGDRLAQLEAAVERLAGFVDVDAVSPVYETAPMYVMDQPPFLNACLCGRTVLTPLELLRCLKTIETELGRVPGQRFGPRAVDLDILFYGSETIDMRDLTVPHPRITERAFVLVPLNDIAPDWRHPILGRTVAELAESLGNDGSVRRIAPGLTAPDAGAMRSPDVTDRRSG